MNIYMTNVKFSFSTQLSTPAVCMDVDGVLKLGRFPIPGAKESIQKLRRKNIPIAILTNGGGETEELRGKKLSLVLNLNEPEDEIQGNEVTLCHSPMRNLLKEYNNKNVLITGTGDVISVMKKYGFKKYLTAEEYATIFPQAFPPFFVKDLLENYSRQEITKIVENRLEASLRTFPQISSIFQLTDVIKWELNTQLFSDILISPNGIPGEIRDHKSPQFAAFHLANADLLYKDSFALPRLAGGSFFYSLEHLFKMKYNRKIEYISYGKPNSIFFEYSKKGIIQRAHNRKITNFYMIGDNPEVDIRGANDNGFISILVRTGVFQGGENDLLFPAKKVVKDIREAVDMILSHEGLL